MNHFLAQVKPMREYRAIAAFYGTRRAERSRVPLINHIHEGVAIIGALNGVTPGFHSFSKLQAAGAYCLHPMFQNDKDLRSEGVSLVQSAHPPRAGMVMYAMEYRQRANAWLSDKVQKAELQAFPTRPGPIDFDVDYHLEGKPDAGGLSEVRAMLIADKVQNYKDFLAHHKGTHARSGELDLYFKTWLDHLGVSEAMFRDLSEVAATVSSS